MMKTDANALTINQLTWASPNQRHNEFSLLSKLAEHVANKYGYSSEAMSISPLDIDVVLQELKEKVPHNVIRKFSYHYLVVNAQSIYAVPPLARHPEKTTYIMFGENQAGDKIIVKERRESTLIKIEQALKEGQIACHRDVAISVMPYHAESREPIFGESMFNSIRIIYRYLGINLHSYLAKNKALFTESDRVNLAIQMINQVAMLHKDNIAHLNINPSHFVINPDTGVVKLISYGYAEYSIHQHGSVLQCDPHYALCGLNKDGFPPTKMEIDVFALLRILHMPQRILVERENDLIEKIQDRPETQHNLFSESVSKNFFDEYCRLIMHSLHMNKPSTNEPLDEDSREMLKEFFYSGLLAVNKNLAWIGDPIVIPSAETLLHLFIKLWQEKIDQSSFQPSKNTLKPNVIIDIIHQSTHLKQPVTKLASTENDSEKSTGSIHTHKPYNSCSPMNSGVRKYKSPSALAAEEEKQEEENLPHQAYSPSENRENQENYVEKTGQNDDNARAYNRSQRFFNDLQPDKAALNLAPPQATDSIDPSDKTNIQIESIPPFNSNSSSKATASSMLIFSTNSRDTEVDSQTDRPRSIKLGKQPSKTLDTCSICSIG